MIVWLKRPGNATDKARLVAVSEELSSHIPHIRRVAWGEALPSTRPAVDDSFDLAFVMEFSGRTSLEAYEIHPAHIRAVKDTLRPLARRVVIYDIARR